MTRPWNKIEWESEFAEEQSVQKRVLFAFIVAIFSLGLAFCSHRYIDYYFPSLTIIAVMLVALYSGLYLSLTVAISLRIITYHLFIQPFLGPSNSRGGYERFFISIVLALSMSYLGSLLRAAFRNVMIAKKEAERSREEAARAATTMEQVLALVSHDIRNYLTTIKMWCELILKTPSQTEKHRTILMKTLQRLTQVDSMIQDLLDVESMRSGKIIALEFHSCDLKSEVEHMIEEMSLLYGDRIKITATGHAFGVWGLSGIRRAIENLVINAIKYGDANTPILIKLNPEEDLVTLSVQNQGGEIDIDDQRRLFEPFVRTPSAKNSSIKGWGLGLTLVKGVMEAHGGHVKVENTKNSGTQFILEFPFGKDRSVRDKAGLQFAIDRNQQGAKMASSKPQNNN